MTWTNGDTAHLVCTFSLSDVVTDPTLITLKVMNPAGTITTYTYAGATITKDSTGVYSKDVALPTTGLWRYRWEGTSPVAAAEEGEIVVWGSFF